jgi:superfamily II DNA or RNA helicase
MTPFIKVDKHYTNIFHWASDALREEFIRTFAVEVPNFWFAKKQMNKKASHLRTVGQQSKADALERRAKAWDGTKKFVYDYKTYVRVPTGLLHDVFDFFSKRGMLISLEDNRKFLPYDTNTIELHGITLYPYQQQSIQIMAERGNGVLLVGTSGGKTEIAAGLIKKLHTPITLFLTHRNLLETQTRERLENRLNQDIGLIAGGVYNPKQITVAMVPTLYSKLKNKDATITKFLKTTQLVIGDEIHLGTADSWVKIFKTVDAPNVYGMSGTPWKKHNIDDRELMAIIGPEIFKVSTKWLIDNHYVTPPVINVVPFVHRDTDGMTYEDVISQHVVNNTERNNLIRLIIEKDKHIQKQTLILVNYIEHGEVLQKILKGYGAELIHSKIHKKKIEQTVNNFINKKIDLLISTPLLDVGVDIPVLDKLILSGSGKAITSILQRIGRSLRISEGKVLSEVYDIFDINENYLTEHAKERVLIYSEENQQFKMEICDIGNQLDNRQQSLFGN